MGIGGDANATPNERISPDARMAVGLCFVAGRHRIGGFDYVVI